MVEAIAGALELEPHHLRDGRRMRRVNHVVELVRYFQRHARATGARSGLKRRAGVAAALYADRGREDAKRSMLRWEAIAERAGLLRVADARGGATERRGIRWELLTEWQAIAAAFRAGGANPRPSSCEARRRPENRAQRRANRVRPWCRRVGNRTPATRTAVGRLVAVQAPGGKPGFAPLGLGRSPKGDLPSCGLDAHEGRIVEKSLIDALDGDQGPGRPAAGGSLRSPAIAALEACRNGSPGDAGRWLDRAEQSFESTLGAPLGGRLRDCGAAELLKAAARWERATGRLAALNGWSPPDAIAYLEVLLGAELEGLRRGDRARPPRHLGYFRPLLLAEARRNERRARQREAAARPAPPADALAYVAAGRPMAPADALAYVAAAPIEELERLIGAAAEAATPADPGPAARRAAALAALELVEAARAAGHPDVGGRAPAPADPREHVVAHRDIDNPTEEDQVGSYPRAAGAARRADPDP